MAHAPMNGPERNSRIEIGVDGFVRLWKRDWSARLTLYGSDTVSVP